MEVEGRTDDQAEVKRADGALRSNTKSKLVHQPSSCPNLVYQFTFLGSKLDVLRFTLEPNLMLITSTNVPLIY